MYKFSFCILFIFFSWNLLYSQNVSEDTVFIDKVFIKADAHKEFPISTQSTTLVLQKDIEQVGHTNVLPALHTFSSGIFVTERGIAGFGLSTGGSGAITLRGLGGSPNNTILILIDGHPQYQGIFGHPLPDAYSTSSTSHVEVIRGPASILYGSNALGGAVHIHSEKQQNDGVNAFARASYGSFNTRELAFKLGYKKEKLHSFFSFDNSHTDGHRENSDFTGNNAFFKIGYDATPHVSFLASYGVSIYDANDNGTIYDPQEFTIDVFRSKTLFSISNTYTKTTGKITLFSNDGVHIFSDGWESTDKNAGLMAHQTVTLSSRANIRFGADFKTISGITNSGFKPDTMLSVQEMAAYSLLEHTIFKKGKLSLGARIEHNSLYTQKIIPYGGIMYAVSKKSDINISYSKGFRNPTIMELYVYAPNENLLPENVMNYEVSYTYKNSKYLQAKIAAFMLDGKNIIQVEGQYPHMQRQNVGNFQNSGIEVDVMYTPEKNISASANYTFLHLKEPLLAAPKHQLNMYFRYIYKNFRAITTLQYVADLYTSITPCIQESYVRLNARAEYQITPNIATFFDVKNVLNQTYQINYGYPMPGISFQLGASFQFEQN